MRVLLLSPPGAGKGTQGERISEYFGITHIAAGELLREHVKKGTELGQQVSEAMERGDLVGDEVVLEMLREPVTEALRGGGYVLDGFPRTVAQAELAQSAAVGRGAAAQVALYLRVEEEELVRRLLARAETEGRSDDTEPVIRRRLKVYEEATAPVVEWYRMRGLLVSVDGAREPDEVTREVLTALEVLRPIVDHVPEAAVLPVDLGRLVRTGG